MTLRAGLAVALCMLVIATFLTRPSLPRNIRMGGLLRYLQENPVKRSMAYKVCFGGMLVVMAWLVLETVS